MRSGFASLLVIATACGATSPRPLPPRRVSFAQTAPVQAPPDLPQPTEPPIRHERYAHWMLLADFASLVPLTHWMGRPDDVYLALPSLLLPPLIHVAHGEVGTASVSLALRSAMVAGVYLAGRSLERECDASSDFICVPLGSLLLIQLAIVPVVLVDAIFLARTAREERGWRRLPLRPSIGTTSSGHRVLTLSTEF